MIQHHTSLKTLQLVSGAMKITLMVFIQDKGSENPTGV